MKNKFIHTVLPVEQMGFIARFQVNGNATGFHPNGNAYLPSGNAAVGTVHTINNTPIFNWLSQKLS